MNEGTKNAKDPARDDVLEDLFKHAEARQRPPVAVEEAARHALREQWRDAVGRRRRRLAASALAAAAMVVIALGVLLRGGPGMPPPGEPVATVEKTVGTTRLVDVEGAGSSTTTVGMRLETGQRLRVTHGGGAALRWDNGIALRLDQNSRLRLVSDSLVELEAGRVYLDTGGVDTAAVLEILTPAGPVRHVGTRFIVSVNPGSTSVSVREGRVLLGDDAASRGERLVVRANGRLHRETIAVYGAAWLWAENLAPQPRLEERNVAELLQWIGRETGRVVEYGSPGAERLAIRTSLRGAMDWGPLEALGVIDQTTDLTVEIRAGTISVWAPSED